MSILTGTALASQMAINLSSSLPTVSVSTAQVSMSTAYTIVLDGQEIALETGCAVYQSRTFLPMRELAGHLGDAIVEWDNDNRIASVSQNGITIAVPVQKTQAVVVQADGAEILKEIDETNPEVPSLILNGTTFLPLRFITENLGYTVDYVSATREIIITSPTVDVAEEVEIEEVEEVEEVIEEVEEVTTETTLDLSESVIYDKMVALQSQYPDGTPWDNSNSYTPLTKYYSSAMGCAGFAHMLSDAAFGTLPERKMTTDFEGIRVGDIVRMNGDTHSVIILGIDGSTVTIAEGNINRSVMWGRTYTFDNLMSVMDYYITRYPQ